MRRRWGLIVLGGFTAAAVGIAWSWWRSETKGRSLEDELAAARREGLPIEPRDLMVPAVPEDRNGAVPYLRAAALTNTVRDRVWLRKVDALTTQRYRKRPLETLSKGERVRLLGLLDLHRPAVAALREAVARPEFALYRPWDRLADTIPSDVRPAADLMRDLAMRAELQDLKGDTAQAWDDLLLAARGSALFRHGVLPRENDARMGVQFVTLESAARITTRHPTDPETPRRLREIVVAFGPPADLRHAMRAQIVHGRQYIVSLGRDASPFTSAFSLRSVRDANEAAHLAYWRAIFRRLPQNPLDFEGTRRTVQEVDREIYPAESFGVVVGVMTINEVEIDELAQAEARRRMALAVADVLEARQRTGRWPKALPRAYPDPFGGNLRYRVEKDVLLVYSVDKDREDNGGVDWRPNDPGQDLVMRIEWSAEYPLGRPTGGFE